MPVSLEQRFSLVRSKIGETPLWHAPSCTHSPGNPENQVVCCAWWSNWKPFWGLYFVQYPAYGTVTGCWTSEWRLACPLSRPLCPSAKICRVFGSNGSDGWYENMMQSVFSSSIGTQAWPLRSGKGDNGGTSV